MKKEDWHLKPRLYQSGLKLFWGHPELIAPDRDQVRFGRRYDRDRLVGVVARHQHILSRHGSV
jgi:hypothetical protein